MKTEIIRLLTSDAVVFEVERDVIKCSETISTIISNLGLDTVQKESIPLPNVHSTVLKKLLEWAEVHKDDVCGEDEDQSCNPDFDSDFVKVDMSMLYELILATNYLNIRQLFAVCCRAVADIIRGKTAEELREIFSITNDFTPEEEEQIRQENFWCTDMNE